MPNPLKLLDKNFVSDYFSKKITSPQYQKINWQNIKITPYKKILDKNNPSKFYHFVIRYDVEGLSQPIFCTTNSKENREDAHRALNFINSKIKKQSITPIFYSEKFKALFYLGVDGENLQYYIKEHPSQINPIIKETANWLAKLHQIKVSPKEHNFNPQNSKVETIVPGADYYLERVENKAPDFLNDIKKLFIKINNFDKKNIKKNGHYLIHGDIHPENVILNKETNKIAIIDYTDVCVADFARDLANFSHQLDYMVNRFNPSLKEKLPEIQKTFLNSYLKKTGLKLSSDLKKRINCYMAWTSLRNAVFFLIKEFQETQEAKKMITKAYEYLNL
ncbi:phosphotransferase [Candidatus Falkowbacteria bacterium]|nr:phosphotransferase [Candidatus Falkowbacteria bacterium]